MKIKNKHWLAGILAVLLLPTAAFAGFIDTDVINEKWGKPTFAYGVSLSKEQVEETGKLLSIADPENVNAMSVSGEDLVRYLGDGIASNDSMISSVLVTRQDKGKGVEVSIATPENITQISPHQYANAAITAGVTDAKISVAAVRPVTGESALTGVFKAFDANGEVLDTERMEVAQEELETTNSIVQEKKSDAGFDVEKLNAAMQEIKVKLTELKERTDKLATREEIETIINDALAKYELDKVITKEHIERLIALFEKYQQTAAIHAPEIKQQLEQLSGKLNAVLKDVQDSGILDTIGQFFQDIFDWLKNLFN